LTLSPQNPSPNEPTSWQIAPVEHVVQFYDRDSVLLDSLAGFVSAGLLGGESAIVIATREHIQALDEKLNKTGINVEINRLLDHYITVVADEALSSFMEHRWIDGYLFHELVTGLLDRARATGRPVRAFGEMVALLWGRGQIGPTIQLERLWNRLCKEYSFSLFCAYPKNGFPGDMSDPLTEICAAHSRIV
jgi:MEDS: MEthanogen/methylotroph, DcmR Sensory domain